MGHTPLVSSIKLVTHRNTMSSAVQMNRPFKTTQTMRNTELLAELNGAREAGVQKHNLANLLFKGVAACRFSRVRFLLNNGVSANVVNDLGHNLLITALYIEDEEKRDRMFKYLVTKGTDCCYSDQRTGRDVLCWASLLGRIQQVHYLLETSSGEMDLTKTDKHGMTALHYATIQGHLEVVRLLVESMNKYRLSVDITDGNGMTPYIHANRLGFYDIAELLVKKGHCSRNQFDNKLHRSVEDWVEIGMRERINNIKRQRRRILEEYKIMGRIPSLMIKKDHLRRSKLRLPAITLSESGASSSGTPLLLDQLEDNEYPDSSDRLTTSDSRELTGHRQQRASKPTLPRLVSQRGGPTNALLDGQVNKSVETAFALLRIQARQNPDVSQAAHFQQTDGGGDKGASFSGVMGNISSMMDVLSQQQSDSFRVVAKAATPPPVKAVPVHQEKKKVSTLAILFGRNNRTKTKRRTTGSKRPNNKTLGQTGKRKSGRSRQVKK